MTDQAATRIRISGGRVIDPANDIDRITDLFLADGRVVALGAAPDGFRAESNIDASGRIVAPGLIDLCARLREPGQEHKATIAGETAAAVAGGITTLCVPPDTDPVIDTPAVVELIHQRAELSGKARVVTIGALTLGLDGERLSEMAALREAGCPGVSNCLRPIGNTHIQRRAMEYAGTYGLTVFLHAQDPWLADGGCAHEGPVASRMGLPGIPAAAEIAAVARDLALIEQTGVRAHFCRLTTARAVQMVARAQYDGAPVTADVAVPYLFLTEMDLAGFNAQCHVNPPFRTQRDREALRAALVRGTLGAICSDHQPHEADAKLAPFAATEPGISGIDTLLGLTLKLVEEGVLTLPQAIERLTAGPAAMLGLSDHGRLNPGAVADIVVFDADAHWRVTTDSLHSSGHNTPFEGWELSGRVSHTLVAGRLVYGRAGT